MNSRKSILYFSVAALLLASFMAVNLVFAQTTTTVYYTVSKTVYVANAVPSYNAVDSWWGNTAYPDPSGMDVASIYGGDGSWSQIQRGLSGRTFGNLDWNNAAFVLDSENQNYFYAHRDFAAPEPTATPTQTPPSQNQIPGISSIFNVQDPLVVGFWVVIVILGLYFVRRKK